MHAHAGTPCTFVRGRGPRTGGSRCIADLPRVLIRHLGLLSAFLEAGGVLDFQLLRQLSNDWPRYGRGIP